jgi:hypothetical protein
MWGVGKFQRIWNTRATEACPHCGEKEDALHVWLCKDPSVKTVWENSLKNLTDPAILTGVLSYLHAWQNDHNLQPLNSRTLQHMLQLQDTIGARQFFESSTTARSTLDKVANAG